ncbi:MAG: hypothetical protein ACN6QI_10565 [Pseudomonas sp.]|uniref:hypothetical protein n=1 Tax=unclassified Pseudomonas TaxID=196821 RepID=UPI001E503797|nr:MULTISPECIES: hypothetical protein [unclassified Pseudomonas]UVM65797.1 hypothetical protein LOY34_21155 [Pseudomonas sp. B21-009]
MSKIEPKSPLTIIAIFAGIIEASALASLPFLGEDSQGIYTWFLVGFPFFLTVLFFLTLNFNYKSLYSPELNEPTPGVIPAPDTADAKTTLESPAPALVTSSPVDTPADRPIETPKAIETANAPAINSGCTTVTIALRGPAAADLISYFALHALKSPPAPDSKWILCNLDSGRQTVLLTRPLNGPAH